MSYIRPRLTVSQSLAQHQFAVIQTIRRLLDRTYLEDAPVDQAVHDWYRKHSPRVRSLLRHEEPLYTALAILGDPHQAEVYEQGPNRERYLAIVREALAEWWSNHPELVPDDLGDGRPTFTDIDDVD